PLLAALASLGALGMLAACGTSAPPPGALPPQASPDWPAGEPARGDGRLYRIAAADSVVRIHVYRAGRAARLGHNHVLTLPRLRGWVWLPDEGLDDAGFGLDFRLDEMALDLPEQRAALGPGWASAVSPEAVAATRANMLGEGNLQAGRYPLARLRSLQLRGELPQLVAELEIELHGQRRRQWLALRVEPDGPRLRARGAFVLRQSEFGIAPFSVLGGLLAVGDELSVEFELVAQRV
ncbi:MAG: YceI family protein, partial [Burkholderiaceae bacterium]